MEEAVSRKINIATKVENAHPAVCYNSFGGRVMDYMDKEKDKEKVNAVNRMQKHIVENLDDVTLDGLCAAW